MCTLGGKGRKQQAALYLTGEAAARTGAPVCLLPPRPTPSSALVLAGARPMKRVATATTPAHSLK